MKATHIVKNKEKIMGFIVDNRYVKYYEALYNIDLIDNLGIESDRIVYKKLKDVSIQEVNKQIYNKIAKENSLVRDIQKNLELWKKKSRNKILYVRGARQTGKTTELLKFAYKNYDQIIYIDFFQSRERENFESYDLSDYCKEMLLEDYIDDKNTILILDEIQKSREIYNHLDTLNMELNCDIAVIVNELEILLDKSSYVALKDVEKIELFPLSLEEFCTVIPDENLYLHIGGYPAVIKQYLKSKDIGNCMEIEKSVVKCLTEELKSFVDAEHLFQYVFQLKANNKPLNKKKRKQIACMKYAGIIDKDLYFVDLGVTNYVAGLTAVDNEMIESILRETFLKERI